MTEDMGGYYATVAFSDLSKWASLLFASDHGDNCISFDLINTQCAAGRQ